MRTPLAIVLAATIVAAAGIGGYLAATGKLRLPDVAEVPRKKSVEPGAALHKRRGVITAVSAPDGYLELKHEPIPSMKWGEVKMGFAVTDAQMLAGLKKGDTVEFEMRRVPNKNGDFVIEKVAPLSGENAPSTP